MNTLYYTKKTVFSGLCIALCVVLPLAFHAVPNGGSIFSPMHIPVLLCGLICGAEYGFLVGIFGPLLSSVITQMPPMAYLAPMIVELCVYGTVCGIMMKLVRTKKLVLNIYISLICAMLLGRVVAGAAKAFVFMSGAFTFDMFVTGYFVTSLPGALLQIIIIPPVVFALSRAGIMARNEKKTDEFESYLLSQQKMHPSMNAQDAVKLCYQAAYGAEHLLNDVDAARKYLFDEFEKTESCKMPLFEQISPEVCRINIAAWKYASLKKEWLFNMFSASVRTKRGTPELFKSYLDIAKKVLKIDGFDEYLASYKGGAVHHSDVYRENEKPAYRIVDKRYVRLIPILERINSDTRVISLEGRAASGKSTSAKLLSDILSAPVVHMDDFFLPPHIRSEERLQNAGGNVHYERFCEEVLPHIREKNEFSYRVFDCGKMDFGAESIVTASDLRIVEGAYSLHPAFGEYADIKVFFDVSGDEQMRRIIARNGEQMAEMFKSRWIPLEEEYYKSFKIKEKCDIIIKS